MPTFRSSGPRTAVAPLWQPGAAELIRWAANFNKKLNPRDTLPELEVNDV